MQVQHSRIRNSPVKKTKQLLGQKLVSKKDWSKYNILSLTITSVCTIKYLVEDKINIFNINNFSCLYVHYLEQRYSNRRHSSQKICLAN